MVSDDLKLSKAAEEKKRKNGVGATEPVSAFFVNVLLFMQFCV